MDDHNEPAPRPFLSFGPGMRVFLLLAMYMSCIGIYSLIASSPQLAWLNVDSKNGYPVSYAMLAIAIQSVLIFGIPALIYVNAFPPERFAWLKINRRVSPLLLILAGLAMLFVFPGVNQLASWISHSISNPELKEYEATLDKENTWLMAMPGVGALLLCLFVNALIPAICEELFFRGCIQQILLERSRIPHFAIVLTAAIFALMHFTPSSAPAIFIAGLMLGYAFYWTGSLRINMLMHFLFNGISIVAEFFAQRHPAFANWEQPVNVFVLSFVLAGLFFFLLWKKAQQDNGMGMRRI